MPPDVRWEEEPEDAEALSVSSQFPYLCGCKGSSCLAPNRLVGCSSCVSAVAVYGRTARPPKCFQFCTQSINPFSIRAIAVACTSAARQNELFSCGVDQQVLDCKICLLTVTHPQLHSAASLMKCILLSCARLGSTVMPRRFIDNIRPSSVPKTLTLYCEHVLTTENTTAGGSKEDDCMSDGGVEPSEAGSDSFFVADGYLSGGEGIAFDDDNDADCTTAMQLGAPSSVLQGKAAVEATAKSSHCGWAVLPVIAFCNSRVQNETEHARVCEVI